MAPLHAPFFWNLAPPCAIKSIVVIILYDQQLRIKQQIKDITFAHIRSFFLRKTNSSSYDNEWFEWQQTKKMYLHRFPNTQVVKERRWIKALTQHPLIAAVIREALCELAQMIATKFVARLWALMWWINPANCTKRVATAHTHTLTW